MRFHRRRLACVLVAVGFLLVIWKFVQVLHLVSITDSLRNIFQQNLFHSGPLEGQYLVDYIAAKLKVEYIRSGIFNGRRKYVALTNSGQSAITGGNWTIYFSQVEGIGSGVANKRSFHVEQSGVIVRHLDQWLYSIEPAEHSPGNYTFQPILPNQTLVVRAESSKLDSRSYAFPNWYVSGHLLEPRIIRSTESRRADFAGDFGTLSPSARYNQNRVRDLKRAAKMIIPTPRSIKNISDGIVVVETDWRIAYPKELMQEASFIAEKLQLSLFESDKEGPRTVSIGLTDLTKFFRNASEPVIINEAYTLKIKQDSSIIVRGQTSAGVFYGLQSLVSLLANSHDGRTVPLVEILDAPRLEYRGLMLDVARNFIKKSEIIRTLDVMAMYKLNKLHFHLSDDQGWRIEIPALPELTQIGSLRGHDIAEEKCLLPYFGSSPIMAFNKGQYYTVRDYQDILEHAKRRHIEVIPEIDMPGHAHAAIQSMRMRYKRLKREGGSEEFASKFNIFDVDDASWYFGVNQQKDTAINPCLNSTYTFVEEILSSIINLHKDIQPLKIIHFGGDEVPRGAFAKSPICKNFLINNPTLRGKLKSYFMKSVISAADRYNVTIQAWEDGLMPNRDALPLDVSEWTSKNDVTINAWTNPRILFPYANAGYKVVLSQASRLYLDHPYEADEEEIGLFWATRSINSRLMFTFTVPLFADKNAISYHEARRVYGLRPHDDTELYRPENIIGMEASLWGEMLRSTEDVQHMLYPRLLAVAERAWHMADWEKLGNLSDGNDFHRLQDDDWTDFANTVGYKELKRLDLLGIHYRLPTPGLKISAETGSVLADGTLQETTVSVNTEFPGTLVQYSKDGGKTWLNLQAEEKLKIQRNKSLQFTAVSYDLRRRGRVINLI